MTSEPISSVEPNRRRSLRSWQPGDQPWELKGSTRGQQVLRDLASNDYLGLARHPAVIEAAAIAIDVELAKCSSHVWKFGQPFLDLSPMGTVGHCSSSK